MFTSRKYAILSSIEIDKIDFTVIHETSIDTLRKTKDETKAVIKWDGEDPEFISQLETLEGPYTYTEIMNILSAPEWSITTTEI